MAGGSVRVDRTRLTDTHRQPLLSHYTAQQGEETVCRAGEGGWAMCRSPELVVGGNVQGSQAYKAQELWQSASGGM